MPDGAQAPEVFDPADCWFDDHAADAACRFFENSLRLTEGEWAGRPFILQDWQRALVRKIFGTKRADGTRRYRQVYLEVPRKNGKTELAAGLALLLLIGDGEFSGQVYSMGVDKDQARITINKATTMVGLNPDLGREIETYKTSLWCQRLLASMKALSSRPGSKHGFSPSGAVADEIHEWPDGEVADVVHKGTAARRQPLEIYITTAGIYGQGFGWEMHDKAVGVLAGEIDDPGFLAVIYAADKEDEDNWQDEKVWAKANPNIGISPKWDFLRSEAADAAGNPRKENAFKRFHLNIWTDQVERWLPMDRWDACQGDLDWRALEDWLAGRECWGGLDLSSTTDLTGLVWAFPPEAEGDPWAYLYRAWITEASLKRRIKGKGGKVSAGRRDRAPYQTWADQGALLTTPGDVVDYDHIEARIYADAERFRVRGLAIDRWNATQVAVHVGEAGLPVTLFGQGFASMAAPSKELERQVMGAGFVHGDQPVARWMAARVAVAEDPAGNIKPDKAKTTDRIDLIVAQIMAVGIATAAEAEQANDLATYGIEVI